MHGQRAGGLWWDGCRAHRLCNRYDVYYSVRTCYTMACEEVHFRMLPYVSFHSYLRGWTAVCCTTLSTCLPTPSCQHLPSLVVRTASCPLADALCRGERAADPRPGFLHRSGAPAAGWRRRTRAAHPLRKQQEQGGPVRTSGFCMLCKSAPDACTPQKASLGSLAYLSVQSGRCNSVIQPACNARSGSDPEDRPPLLAHLGASPGLTDRRVDAARHQLSMTPLAGWGAVWSAHPRPEG